jgi:hypothetical protein
MLDSMLDAGSTGVVVMAVAEEERSTLNVQRSTFKLRLVVPALL